MTIYVLGQYLKRSTCIVLQYMYCVISPQCVPSFREISIIIKIDIERAEGFGSRLRSIKLNYIIIVVIIF